MKLPLQVFNFNHVYNDANDSIDIHIDGDIVDAGTQAMFESWFGDDTSVSFKSFRNQISSSPAKTYNIYINSPGGLVTDAMAMHDFIIDLQNQGKTVNTIGRGIVASAATYILMASKNAEMSKNSWFMIHNVSGGMWGDVNQMERYVTTLRQFNDRSRDFYAEYTNMRKEDVAKLMNNETWMTADDAKEKGFIKSVSGDASFTQKIPKEQWQFSDTSVLNAYNSAVKLPQQQEKETFLQTLKEDMKNLFTEIINSIKGTKVPENASSEQIVNAIAEGIAPHFQEIHSEIETEVSNQVAEALKGEAITNAVKVAVDAQMAEHKQALKDMETEVVNKIATPTNTTVNNGKQEKAFGTYVTEN